MNFTILRFDTIDSTNTEAAKQAKLGADEGLCVIAQQQTSGRGRHGRTWISEKDSGLYFSIVLRPKIDMRFLPLITLMTGVAVYDALAEFGLKPDIKWVNDILIGDKKVCGILAETVETPIGLAVIVGIGINVTSQNFPDEIADTATSIEAESLSGVIAVAEIETTLTKYLSYWYAILYGENGHINIIGEWQRRSSYFSGKSVRVTLENEVFHGITDGLEENGALRVKTSGGSVMIVQAGDVERLRPNNE
ncbi:MAG: biotin--[acetyl-CoA-carboxylase] ligase [Chloracidobacterium sp.]|nr:biotin--[acetyl-CoA-carboxylase] ligase [Chloracidobacterium sp.]